MAARRSLKTGTSEDLQNENTKHNKQPKFNEICNYARSPDHILVQPLDKSKNNKLRALFLQIQISIWGHY